MKTDKIQCDIASIYNGEIEIKVPAIVASELAAGDIVSTASDNMVFLRAFFKGQLFPKKYLEQMEERNKIFFPMQYGAGIMKCSIPVDFIDSSNYELIGHSGSAVSISYYCPEHDIFITGTTQQLDTAKAMEVVYRLLVCFDYELW